MTVKEMGLAIGARLPALFMFVRSILRDKKGCL
jgi:hypothetical protein